MGQHGAPSRLRVDLVALTALVFLVVALAITVVLSIMASSPRPASSGHIRTEFVGDSTSADPMARPGPPTVPPSAGSPQSDASQTSSDAPPADLRR